MKHKIAVVIVFLFFIWLTFSKVVPIIKQKNQEKQKNDSLAHIKDSLQIEVLKHQLEK